MNISTIKSAWFAFVDQFIQCENLTVIFAETSPGPRPSKPYLSMRLIGPKVLSFQDDQRFNPSTNLFEVKGLREYTISIQAFGVDASDILGEIQTKLSYPEVTEFFSSHDADIGIVDRGDVLNVTELLDTAYEARAAMDVRFYSKSDDNFAKSESTIKTIREVDYEARISNGHSHSIKKVVELPKPKFNYASYLSARTFGTEPYLGIEFYAGAVEGYFSNDLPQPLLDPGLNSFVIEFDYKLETPYDADGVIIDTGGWNEDGVITIFNQGNFLEADIDFPGDGTFVYVRSGSLAPLYFDGVAHRVSLICDRLGNVWFEIDGVISGTPASMADFIGLNLQTAYCWMGNMKADTHHFRLHGIIYGLHWMNGTTTPTDVSVPLSEFEENEFSVALWKMNEASGDITDSVNGIVLNAVGSPGYEVAGP